jgi:bifunctional DNA-binding transcriptional regulator/antitoxin component of YhaV-PrlF toxin-antitoxin module
MDKVGKKLLGTTWLAGDASCLLVVPKALAQQYGIDQPSKVIIEGRPEGILIRKVDALEVAPNSATNASEIIQSPKKNGVEGEKWK